MNCAEIKKLFSPYLDGRVSGSEMRALTRHVERCADRVWFRSGPRPTWR